ncbi:glycoside hydrolase family 39 protein [Xylogone sp. PMI_703]|nr:glycoside hydrolase family 39 protein [Xylogone sp. PMI_703]
MSLLFKISLLAVGVSAVPALQARADNTAVVHLGTSTGNPKHLASGFIYGIPDNGDQIPSHFWSDLDINGCRTGGAQWGAPRRGWVWGLNEYKGRFQSSLSNYLVCRSHGAEVSWLNHDIWGTDHTNSSTIWPGDNGQWASYDAFVHQLLEDLYANNAIDGSVYEIWNEPDISIFWKGKGGMQQWINLYIRTHKIIRSDSRFDGLKIAGPSLAFTPTPGNLWWTEWLRQIAGNGTIPDEYTYHLEGAANDVKNDPSYTNRSLSALLATYHLPQRQVNVNEYAELSEQVPASYAWWIAGLERVNSIGLLGNWQGGTVLHDLFANLLTKHSNPQDYAATDYAPAPGYWVYHYYATNMTGHRVAVDRSGDTHLDVYATVGNDRVRLLVGSKLVTGTWYVTIDDLEAVGFPSSGSLSIDTWGFDGSNVFAAQAPPSFRNTVSHGYSGGSVTFPIYQTDNHTAWAFEFSVRS